MDDLYGFGYETPAFLGGMGMVRAEVDYCAIARADLVAAEGPFQNSSCQEIADHICQSGDLFRDGSVTSNGVLLWAGCGTAPTPVPGGGTIASISATFQHRPDTARVTFSYAGPGGLVAVNWWVTRRGGKPGALGGNPSDEIAYKQATLTLPPLAQYAEQRVDITIPAGYLPDNYVGTLDSWIGVYQGSGSSAQLLGYQGFPGSIGGGGAGMNTTILLGIVGIAAIAGLGMYIASRGTKKILVARLE